MISIIIPKTVNMECTKTSKFPYAEEIEPLKECIESIKKQTYKDYEIIYAEWSDKGNFYSLDKAWRKAKGNIILFFCPLAIFENKNALSDMIKAFNTKKADAISLSSTANKNMTNLFIWLLCLEWENRENCETYTNVAPIIYFAIKREVLKKIGGLNLKNASIKKNPLFDSGFIDWDFCADLTSKGYRIWHTNKIKVYLLYQTGIYGYFKKQFHHAWYRIAFYRNYKIIKDGHIKINFKNINFLYPNVFKFYRKTNDLKVFLFVPIFFLRDIAWMLGVIKGVWDFYIKRGRYA